MGFKCAAYGCKSGYATNTSGETVTFHAFPADPQLRDKWIRANPRKDFTPTKFSRICSLHFRECDFFDVRRDSNKSRLKTKSEKPTRRFLKDGVVPSLFANVPTYLSKSAGGTPRTTKRAASSSRREEEARRMDELEASFHASDDITSLSNSEIIDNLKSDSAVPEGYLFNAIDERLLLYLLQMTNDVPNIVSCICLKRDMRVVCSLEDNVVPQCQYSDLMTDSRVTKLSQLINLMARMKSWHTDPSSKPLSLDVRTAVSILQSAKENLPEPDSEQFRKVDLIIEQLRLLLQKKHGRQYSPELTLFAYMIMASSSAAYNVLVQENILSLPSVSTLKKITRKVDSATNVDNAAYLQLRVSKLPEYERTVILIIDEIYVSKRIEYAGGDVMGLTADGKVASTLLCFMIKSVASRYKDIVAIYPIDKLTASKQHECYLDVMVLLHKTPVTVVAISVDNAATNRKFYVDHLCDGTLKTSITDTTTGQPIFLIFDPVHSLKNVYNNFQRREVFECPPMERNLPHGCSANFRHIAELYGIESTMSLKKAHRLTPAALNPRNIEKTSVKLAVSVFSESTRDALQFYANHQGYSEWLSTAEFLSLVIKLCNVLNVKTSHKGKHKRDYSMDPVRSSLDWKLDFLREFADFLRRWEASTKPGLSKETFLALRHTCLAIADCASFLLDRRGFNYVLLGHVQSDAIESRFGWFRQLAGANYYISTRQVVEGDKKIRAVSLVKFSHLSLTEIDQELSASSDLVPATSTDSVADSIADAITCLQRPSASDANIIYYVSGAISRSVVRGTKCDSCKEALVNTEVLEPLQVDESVDCRASTFLDSVNRGGLVRPAEYAFELGVHCWCVFEQIRTSQELMSQFLTAGHHRTLFSKVIDRVSPSSSQFISIDAYENICVYDHDLKDLFVHKFFNCVAKNLAKELTNKANAPSRQTKRCKIAKLQSEAP